MTFKSRSEGFEGKDCFYSDYDLLVHIQVVLLKAKIRSSKDLNQAKRLKRILAECFDDVDKKIKKAEG